MKKKRCSKCNKVQPLSEYTKLRAGKEGLRAQCKRCDKRYRNKNKKPKMPGENDPYQVNSVTMQDHFYLHFGFQDRRYNASEYADAAKYVKAYVDTTTIKTNRL